MGLNFESNETIKTLVDKLLSDKFFKKKYQN